MKNYRIVIGSPVDYEELTADIVIDGKYILLIQKEEGNDKMIIEFYENAHEMKVYLSDLMEALLEAKTLLSK